MAMNDYGDNEAVRSRGQDLVSTTGSTSINILYFADFLHKSTTGSTSINSCVFFLYVPSFCHNFLSHTFDSKMHHSAMDSQVLSLQCGKATALFVCSKHLDISHSGHFSFVCILMIIRAKKIFFLVIFPGEARLLFLVYMFL